MAETIGIGQLRADTRAYLHRVAGGDTLELVRRGRLTARIEPVPQYPASGPPPGGRSTAGVITVALSGFRSQASRYLDQVGSGCTVHVYHQGQPLAQIRAAAQ
ncbi:hypothetical protein OG976_09945 [Mycobacterium sp. NBC_00419]|uniref:type II toxin-antitoxin system Phd/YefM family antitoxin n=1 Tax=Mycobacterium sp. NBC_00419 TaxID=2975989 RepID=UPI002E1AF7A1